MANLAVKRNIGEKVVRKANKLFPEYDTYIYSKNDTQVIIDAFFESKNRIIQSIIIDLEDNSFVISNELVQMGWYPDILKKICLQLGLKQRPIWNEFNEKFVLN